MAEKLFMTALSPTMEKGTVTEWHKKEGDSVKSGEVLCEVETDKAVMDYESDFEAVLLKIIVNDGQSASVGDVIAFYGEEGEDISDLVADVTSIEDEKPTPKEDTKKEQQSDEPEKDGGRSTKASEPVHTESPVGAGGRIKASPLARKMADDKNIDLASLEGSGYDGRIIKRDVERAAENKRGASVSHEVSEEARGGSELVRVSGMRSRIAERLSASKFSAPHFYLTVSVDMTALLGARAEYTRRTGEKMSPNSYFIRLSAAALKKHPKVNAAWENDKIRMFRSADIGFAVALEDGLIAPVIRSCEARGISSIDEEFRDLADRARAGKLDSSEYSGATFTISNLGSFGIEEFTAIINPPGSAILAIGAVVKTPVVVEDDDGEDIVTIKPMMKMTLSCDHRVIDGAEGASFLSDLKRMIENPLEALM